MFFSGERSKPEENLMHIPKIRHISVNIIRYISEIRVISVYFADFRGGVRPLRPPMNPPLNMVQAEITEQIDIRDHVLSILQVVFEVEINPCICVLPECSSTRCECHYFICTQCIHSFSCAF